MSSWDNWDPVFAEWDWVNWFPYMPWVPSDPQAETADMAYPVDSTNPFTEVLYIAMSVDPYYEVITGITIAS